MSPFMHLIARTGQRRKFFTGLGLLLLGLAALMLGAFFAEALAVTGLMAVAIAASGVGMSGFIYLCLAVRCRNCGARWFWLLTTKRPGDPGHVNFKSDQCPVCGDTGN